MDHGSFLSALLVAWLTTTRAEIGLFQLDLDADLRGIDMVACIGNPSSELKWVLSTGLDGILIASGRSVKYGRPAGEAAAPSLKYERTFDP